LLLRIHQRDHKSPAAPIAIETAITPRYPIKVASSLWMDGGIGFNTPRMPTNKIRPEKIANAKTAIVLKEGILMTRNLIRGN
jgi:hypothetical protein